MLKPLKLMSMGEKLGMKNIIRRSWGKNKKEQVRHVQNKYNMEWQFDQKHIEVYQWGRMIDEEDLRSKMNSIFVGILGTRCFSSMLPSMPKGEMVARFLEAWMLMIFLWGSIVDMLLWWYVTFITEFIIGVNIIVFCGIW